MTETDDTNDEQTCPICGGEYHHKREDRTTATRKPQLRDDATQCKSSKVGSKQTVYVHISGNSPPDHAPSVAGECPECGCKGLLVGAGGYVTCSRINCNDPEP